MMASPVNTTNAVPFYTERPAPGRSDSLTSVASSGLARRPRIRSRTRTLPDGSGWSDSPGFPQVLAGTQDNTNERGIGEAANTAPPLGNIQHLTVDINKLTPMRPPRSPKREMLVVEHMEQETPTVERRDRHISIASTTRSAISSRGQNASLQELLDLKNVRLFVLGLFVI